MQQKELNDSNDDFSARLLSVVAYSGMNQGNFAKLINVSPGFLSDVLRGLKKPGTDFFIKLKQNIDISLDWLISGQGSMRGHKSIDHDLITSIELQIAVIKAAIIDDKAIAKEILNLLKQDNFSGDLINKSHEQFLNEVSTSDLDLNLIVDLYNRNIQLDDSKMQRLNTVSAGLLHYESLRPSSKLLKLTGESSSPSTKNKSVQVNKGSSTKATQNNYFGNYSSNKEDKE